MNVAEIFAPGNLQNTHTSDLLLLRGTVRQRGDSNNGVHSIYRLDFHSVWYPLHFASYVSKLETASEVARCQLIGNYF